MKPVCPFFSLPTTTREPFQHLSYIQMYAFAFKTSSKVVNRTIVSLIYAHCLCCGGGGLSVGSDLEVEGEIEGLVATLPGVVGPGVPSPFDEELGPGVLDASADDDAGLELGGDERFFVARPSPSTGDFVGRAVYAM